MKSETGNFPWENRQRGQLDPGLYSLDDVFTEIGWNLYVPEGPGKLVPRALSDLFTPYERWDILHAVGKEGVSVEVFHKRHSVGLIRPVIQEDMALLGEIPIYRRDQLQQHFSGKGDRGISCAFAAFHKTICGIAEFEAQPVRELGPPPQIRQATDVDVVFMAVTREEAAILTRLREFRRELEGMLGVQKDPSGTSGRTD